MGGGRGVGNVWVAGRWGEGWFGGSGGLTFFALERQMSLQSVFEAFWHFHVQTFGDATKRPHDHPNSPPWSHALWNRRPTATLSPRMALATFLNPFSPTNPSGPPGIPTKVILFGAQTNPGLQFFVIEDPRNPPLCQLGAPFPIWARPGVPRSRPRTLQGFWVP